MNLSEFKSSTGIRSNELFMVTASQGSGKSIMKDLDTKTVYYVMNEHQQEFPHPVYKSENTNKEWALSGNKLRLMMMAEIAFSVTDGKIQLIKHRNYDTNNHVLSDKELKQYRWYMLQAMDT
jgi:hypothetical protein